MKTTPQKRLNYRLTFVSPVRKGSIDGEWLADLNEAVSRTCQTVLQKLHEEHRQLLSGATEISLKLKEVDA